MILGVLIATTNIEEAKPPAPPNVFMGSEEAATVWTTTAGTPQIVPQNNLRLTSDDRLCEGTTVEIHPKAAPQASSADGPLLVWISVRSRG